MPEIIHEKMAKIMRELGPIAKADQNKQQNYAYRSSVRVFNAVHPIMVKHGVTMRSEVVSHEIRERVWSNRNGEQLLVRAIAVIRWMFVAEDGSHVSTTLAVEGCDYQGDKATNKCSTVSQRQAVCQTFMIPTSDAIDSEDSNYDTSAPEQPKGGQNNSGISEKQEKRFWAIRGKSGLSDKQVGMMLKGHGIPVQDSLGKMVKSIPRKKYQDICDELEAEGSPKKGLEPEINGPEDTH